MRSLKLCLLAFLTSCMLSKTQGLLPDFCPHPGTGVDCDHFTPPDTLNDQEKKIRQTDIENKNKEMMKKDFAWTTESSFDLGKAVSTGEFALFKDATSNKYVSKPIVEIDMHRALYIVPKTGVQNIPLKIVAGAADQCKLIYKQGKDFDTTIAGSKSKDISEKTLIAVLDPGCLLYIELADFQKVELINGQEQTTMKADLYHVFSRHLKTSKLFSNILDNKKERGTFIQSIKKGVYEGNCDDEIAKQNLFYDAHTHKFIDGTAKECYYLCHKGGKFEFKLNPQGGTPWANKFKLSKECEWMAVYPDTVTHIAPAEVSLRHSFVKLPLELKVTAMDFNNAVGTGYEVIISYYRDGNKAKMVIANSHGRAVNSYAMYESSQTISIVFSHDECMTDVIGAGLDNKPKGQKKFLNFEFDESVNLGARVQYETAYTAKRYLRDGTIDNMEYLEKKNEYGDIQKDYYEPDKHKEVSHTKTVGNTMTTNADIDPTAIVPTDGGAERRELSSDDYYNINKNIENEKKENMRRRGLFDSKNYFTWAIPAGFGAGSFASFLICNIILFVFKRTVFIFWYKSMYKRYGSDTTMGAGTTMGKTMGGETIGGGTTMGGTTAGGETTGTTTAA